MEEQKEVKEPVKEEVKEEKDQAVEIGFNAGMESIGEPLDVETTLDNIYAALDN